MFIDDVLTQTFSTKFQPLLKRVSDPGPLQRINAKREQVNGFAELGGLVGAEGFSDDVEDELFEFR